MVTVSASGQGPIYIIYVDISIHIYLYIYIYVYSWVTPGNAFNTGLKVLPTWHFAAKWLRVVVQFVGDFPDPGQT